MATSWCSVPPCGAGTSSSTCLALNSCLDTWVKGSGDSGGFNLDSGTRMQLRAMDSLSGLNDLDFGERADTEREGRRRGMTSFPGECPPVDDEPAEHGVDGTVVSITEAAMADPRVSIAEATPVDARGPLILAPWHDLLRRTCDRPPPTLATLLLRSGHSDSSATAAKEPKLIALLSRRHGRSDASATDGARKAAAPKDPGRAAPSSGVCPRLPLGNCKRRPAGCVGV